MGRKKVDIKKLLQSMTLKEKIGQLVQLAPFLFKDSAKGIVTGPMEWLGIKDSDVWNAGSVLGTAGAEETIEIQKMYLERNQKKIPLMFMADIIHGYRTIFPIPLALGCTWDEKLVEKAARVSAIEASAGGVHVTFSPMVDLVRDPRWGRVMESTGEDPYLNSVMARAFVRGYQGDDISKEGNIASCVKHFAAYGAVEGGREYNTVDISERMLREFYLPAYKAAIDEGCKMVMTSFNTVNSIPSSGNKWLLRGILRGEWGFDGVTISDWGAIKELIPHGVAEDEKEAAEKAIKAGADIDMMTGCYAKNLEKLVKEGKVDEKLIDEAVYRILKLKEELGLFENPFKGADKEKEKQIVLCDEHRRIAREVAAASVVLLKNQDVLPFDKNIRKLAIIGPYSDEHAILGPWSWQGKWEESVSLKEGIANKIGESKVLVAKGCEIEGESDSQFKKSLRQALKAANEADIIVLALGEHYDMSGEARSRAFITLPGRQEELAREIIKLGKPTVVVLFNGRPLEIRELYNIAPAILEAWFPGTEGGNAIADILFGDKNPSAKLTMSFPYTVGQIPVYYNHFNTGRPKPSEDSTERFCSHYIDIPNAPLLPFGFGLSYTEFKYSKVKLDKKVLTQDSVIKASVKVKNVGRYPGDEIVQLYIRDMVASVVRPVKELKGFKKIHLEVGEEKEVVFEIREEMLRFHNENMEYVSEKGKFQLMIGPNSKDVQTVEFELR
ncbi:beta-glucosidase BglX [Fervidobacterium gondwanense]|uniref:beta-glucosidase n=2 Tax=Fervidobacterium TaxID=2422 RepID=A0A1M7SKK4_FERGO|nr:beta-glucosidase BglX [Fervidobacterium gondwanense]SHN58975.1 beta-glucosidase [Fervidobacterium gondwanense DSM 13020]